MIRGKHRRGGEPSRRNEWPCACKASLRRPTLPDIHSDSTLSTFHFVIFPIHSSPEQPPTKRPEPVQHVIHVAEVHQLDQVAVEVLDEEERVAARRSLGLADDLDSFRRRWSCHFCRFFTLNEMCVSPTPFQGTGPGGRCGWNSKISSTPPPGRESIRSCTSARRVRRRRTSGRDREACRRRRPADSRRPPSRTSRPC